MSDNNNKMQSGETLSFNQLIEKYKIIIPIIQRDYAQGRSKEKEIRERFLSSIFEHLNSDKRLELDFIYGSIRNNDEFIPLDGQQRLTTLFLLHWYLCQLSNDQHLKESFYNTIKTNDVKSKFYYETRISSTDFFNEIVNFKLPIDKLNNKKISEIIKNCSWYHLSWNYDPTIQGILVMLEAIHEKFKGNNTFFEKLIKNNLITFKFLNLQEYHLTDDLYIKMNSRGRQLTNFENFKAELEKYLEKLNITETKELNGKEVNLAQYFSYKIDTEWSDFFWNIIGKEKNKYDDTIMNFFRVVLTNLYIERYANNTGDETFNKNVEYLLGTDVAKRNPDYDDKLSFYKYKELEVFPENPNGQVIQEMLKDIIDIFDIISTYKNSFEKLLTDYEFYYNEKEEFKKVLDHNFDSYHKRLMFYAFISYLIQHKENLKSNNFDKDKFNQWMRVIHNLSHSDNTRIEEAKDYVKTVISIKNILNSMIKNNQNILEYLTKNNIEGFSSWQVNEEKIKAHLILKGDNWKKEIESAEKHKYFNGQIGFILEFSGIWEYYKENENNYCNWNEEENKKYLDSFSKNSKLASIIFDESYENRINNENNIFERAVLTKGDYLTTASQNRKNLLSTNVVKNNIKRDHSWKRLLRVEYDRTQSYNPQISFNNESQSNNQPTSWQDRRNFVKQVFDDILKFTQTNEKEEEKEKNSESVKEALKSIIKKRENIFGNWRDFFINCPEVFKYCNQGFIRFDDEYNIRIYGESQSNQYHAELYTYFLYIKLQQQVSYKDKIKYLEVRSINDTPGIKILLDGTTLYAFIYLNDNKFFIEIKEDVNNKSSQNENTQRNEKLNLMKNIAEQEKITYKEDDGKIYIDFEISKSNEILGSIIIFLKNILKNN